MVKIKTYYQCGLYMWLSYWNKYFWRDAVDTDQDQPVAGCSNGQPDQQVSVVWRSFMQTDGYARLARYGRPKKTKCSNLVCSNNDSCYSGLCTAGSSWRNHLLARTTYVTESGGIPELHSGTQNSTNPELSFPMNRDSSFPLVMDDWGPENTAGATRICFVYIMVWWCVSYHGTGESVIVDGTKKRADYSDITDQILLDSFKNMFVDDTIQFIFKHDKAPIRCIPS